MPIMLRDVVTETILTKIAKKFKKEKGREITNDEVCNIVNYQWAFLRICMRGGARVTLDSFGTFALSPDYGKGKMSAYIRNRGGYPDAIKTYPVVGNHQEDEVLYNEDMFPDKAISFRVPRKSKNTCNNIFKNPLTSSKKRKED